LERKKKNNKTTKDIVDCKTNTSESHITVFIVMMMMVTMMIMTYAEKEEEDYKDENM
jgi:hypothetical protein